MVLNIYTSNLFYNRYFTLRTSYLKYLPTKMHLGNLTKSQWHHISFKQRSYYLFSCNILHIFHILLFLPLPPNFSSHFLFHIFPFSCSFYLLSSNSLPSISLFLPHPLLLPFILLLDIGTMAVGAHPIPITT